MSMEELRSQLKNKQLGSLYLFYGDETYLIKQCINYIEKLIIQPEFESMNKIVLEGKIEVQAVIDNCETLPVFAERKLVMARNTGLFGSKSKGGKDLLTEYFKDIPRETCLIFIEQDIDKRIAITKSATKYGMVVEFQHKKPQELMAWVVQELKTMGRTIDRMAQSQLVEYCDVGMSEIHNELQKLVLYTEGRGTITSADIEKVCTRSIKSKIFDLTDALSEKNAKKALQVLEEIISLKEPIPRIIYMIAKHLRTLLHIKKLVNEGMRSEDAMKKLSIHPFVAMKIGKQIGKISTNQLEESVKECLNMDCGIKTGQIEDRIAAELIIAKFTA